MMKIAVIELVDDLKIGVVGLVVVIDWTLLQWTELLILLILLPRLRVIYSTKGKSFAISRPD